MLACGANKIKGRSRIVGLLKSTHHSAFISLLGSVKKKISTKDFFKNLMKRFARFCEIFHSF